MKVAVVLPRGMDFSVERATSIDLCAYDLVLHSRFRDNTIIFGEASGKKLPGVRLEVLRASGRLNRVAAVVSTVREERIDAVVVHQNVPSASAIARKIAPVPVLLHRHNFERFPHNPWRRWWKRRRIAAVSRLSFVSEALRDHFIEQWPDGPRPNVVPNGLDMAAWRPGDKTRREIIVVGRAVEVKGILPAALGVETALRRHPAWQASFILSNCHEEPDYFAEVARVVTRSPRTRLLVGQPFDTVKRMTEEADIAIVPSIWQEPFGRTALEALAGGAALVTSGRGGLSEVAGPAAELLQSVDGASIAASLERLIGSEDHRHALQQAGRARAERLFDIRACADRLDDMIEGAVVGATPA